MQLGQHDTKTLVTSAARTTTFTSSGVSTSNVDGVIAYVNISAVSGTSPTLNITLQDSPNGTDWFDASTLAQATAISKQRVVLSSVGAHLRAVCTIAGTAPSFTFSIDLSGKN